MERIMDVPRLQEFGEAQSSSGRKRKRTPRPTSTPINTNTLEVQQFQTSSATQPNGDIEVVGDGENNETIGDGENQDMGDCWEYEDFGDGWEDEIDEEDRPACVEGQIEPGRVSDFLHGEENRQFRSKVWNEFRKIRVAGIVTKGQCNHCSAEISVKRGAGTSAMITHLKRCKAMKTIKNMARQLRSTVMPPEGVSLDNGRFIQEVSRKELTRMISLHGLPLSIIDYEGFRRFVSSLNPIFRMISRRTISDDCLKSFEEQKPVLQDVLKSNKSRVSLTMDMWTSNQTIGYMCITCHFLDDDWKLHKRIVKFAFMKTPHTGVAMFNEILKFIQEWNIEEKLFSITLDNASNNNAMVKLLRSNLLEKQKLCGNGKLFHHRCAAHVLNLICKAGFEIINPIVHKVWESLKFIEGSTSRKQKFEEIIQQLGIEYRKRPNLDTPTRWNSTYLMLNCCLQLKRAFESLTQQDQEYTCAPSLEEWEKARMVCVFLKTFYDATMVISGSHYPTANLYFHEIWEVKIALDNADPQVDADLFETIQYMQRKFGRYWKLTWLQISFPVIFDPRFKLGFIEFRLKQAFGSQAETKTATIKKILLELFKDYSQTSIGSQDMAQQPPAPQIVTNASGRFADWDHHMSHNMPSASEIPSELEAYLSKTPIPRTDTLDILAWWKSNSVEYPTLSRIACDVLAVPASTVASESAFSIGGRIISKFRSWLTPKTVEALICVQDWMRASGSSKFCMGGIEDCVESSDPEE